MKKLVLAAATAIVVGLLTAGTALAFYYTCPADGHDMYWTGRTANQYGQIFKEYRCLNGHTSWGR